MKAMPGPRKKKPFWEGDVDCAWCQKANRIKLERNVITPAEPAEIEISVTAERATQTKLEETIAE